MLLASNAHLNDATHKVAFTQWGEYPSPNYKIVPLPKHHHSAIKLRLFSNQRKPINQRKNPKAVPKYFFILRGGWTAFDQPPMFKFAQFFEMMMYWESG
jgi:hypothetical protein